MLLEEMFDKEQAMKDFDKGQSDQSKEHDTETSMADMIITSFEQGKLTFDEAAKQLKAKGLGVWLHELNMADELLKDKGSNH